MGTSASYAGPKGSNPLVPSWVDEPLAGESGEESNVAAERPEGDSDSPVTGEGEGAVTSLRRAVRSSARSGGSRQDTLRWVAREFRGRAIGKSGRGTRRMAVANRAGSRLVRAFSELISGGAAALARVLELTSLEGLTTDQVWSRLAEFVCSDGGSIDEAVVRVAFFQSLKIEIDRGLVDLLDAGAEQLASFFENFISECVLQKLSQDGGSLLEVNGVSSALAFSHMDALRGVVSVTISKRLRKRDGRLATKKLTSNEIDATVAHAINEAINAVGDWGEGA